MKNLLITISAVCSLLAACDDGGAGKTVRKDFQGKSREVRADSLPITVTINPLYGKLNADNLVLASPAGGEGVLNVFSLPEMEFLYSAVRRGRAADELLAVNWAHSMLENTVSLYDIPGARLRSYRVTRDTLTMIREYPLKERTDDGSNLTMPYVSMIQLDETKFLTRAAARHFDMLKLQNLESGTTISTVPDLLDKDPSRDQYLDYDYILGFGNNSLVRAYYYLDRVEIYRMNGDDGFSPEAVITDSQNYESNLNSGDRTVYYRDIYCGDRNIYLLYSGVVENSARGSHIEVFDYDGNSVSVIDIDRPLDMILVDEARGVIYGVDPYTPDYIHIFI